jgi:hypothetical protein
MYGKYIKHPIAISALSQALLQGWPRMGGKMAVENAVKILEFLHSHGLQVGPAEGFGEQSPRDLTRRGPRVERPKGDMFDNFMDELRKTEERRPWEIR